ncbi:MAG: hypothetical protein JXD18_07450 [Anaerolineae bacterium]|nr:hypothetical protein [Anaerolineae bacterium]
MKGRAKLAVLMAVVLVFMVFPARGAAHTADEPFVTDLLAGQTIDAGDVRIWNDGANLFVEYVTDGGWCLTETHLQVATTLEGIPQRNGNPVPGQFDYRMEHACISAYTYQIPISWPVGTQLYIAAHAVVADGVGTVTSWDYRIGSVPGVPVYGPVSAYALLGAAEWGESHPAVVAVPHPSWPVPPARVYWISTAEYVEDPVNDSWRWFHEEVATPEGAFVCRVDFSLYGVTSDNAEEVYFNGVLIGSDGEVSGPFVDNQEWATFMLYQTAFIADPPATLSVDFIVRNYAKAGGTPASNPTGLLYKGKISCKIETPPETETAWGDGEVFPGRNWATYFTYIVQ